MIGGSGLALRLELRLLRGVGKRFAVGSTRCADLSTALGMVRGQESGITSALIVRL